LSNAAEVTRPPADQVAGQDDAVVEDVDRNAADVEGERSIGERAHLLDEMDVDFIAYGRAEGLLMRFRCAGGAAIEPHQAAAQASNAPELASRP
jgi:hypothetical protein